MKGEQQPLFGRTEDSGMDAISMWQAPEGEHPRQRFKAVGPAGLSQRELLAIVVRTGPVGIGALKLADTLLDSFDGLAGLARTNIHELQRISGIGETRAIEIKAA